MNVRALFLAVLTAACTVVEAPAPESVGAGKMTARMESVDGTGTRVYADAGLRVLWDSGDEITVFNRNTCNRQYRFTGATGANAGAFEEVNPSSGTTGAPLDLNYAVYPYASGTGIGDDGVITLDLPAVQNYRDGSFGRGANTMVAATEGTELLFRNLCSYLVLKFYGTGVSVSSITLKGNRDEVLAGPADVCAAADSVPSLSFHASGTSTTLTLNCDPPVILGATAETPTVFWIVVPPVGLAGGFTVTVTAADGGIFERSTSAQTTFVRNTTHRMQALEVTPAPCYLVTNPYVQKYMEEVQYGDLDFSFTSIFDYEGGGPGENDIPPSVTIEWPSTSARKLRLWDDGWSREYSVSSGATSLAVGNLVPGSHYSYEVQDKKGTVLSQGSFYTRGSLHQVYYRKKVRNSRDLGGWMTADGRMVRYRKLYRGGQMDYSSYLSSEGRTDMLADGIKAELDLRESKYVSSSSSLGSGYSFLGPGFDSGYYPYMLGERAECVRACFEFIVNCLRNDEPVFFHCFSGRDRTGTLSILLLGVLGVREGDLAKDYELTYFSPGDWSLQSDGLYHHIRTVETYRATVEYLASLDTSSFKAGCEHYLLSIGVSRKDIDDFRSMMLK